MSLAEAVIAGATPEELATTGLQAEFLAARLRVEDEHAFDQVDGDRDVRKTLHVSSVPMPELAPDKVLIAVMASSVNYNTVWASTFEPVSTFGFLKACGRQGGWAGRHDQPFHVLGSDGAGVIVRVGIGVRHWRVGDHVMVNAAHVDDQEASVQADGMLSEHQLAWGFETNYGGLAQYTVVLIWGAAGGLGAYAVQMVKNGGGVAVEVVGSEQKAEVARALGCDLVINRAEIGIGEETGDDPATVVAQGKRLGRLIRQGVGEDPHIAFDHVGRSTFDISVFVVRRGGTVVTCGSSTGYQHQFDNRYLWMRLKRIIGSHVANLQEQVECARLFAQGSIVPALSSLYPLHEVGSATRLVQLNEHIGKVGVLCLADRPGLGVTDPQRRARIGEDRLTRLRAFALDGERAR
jgi:crotonyl-CoA reductase